MPIYEYRCLGCGKVSSLYTRSINTTVEPRCGHCQSLDVQRAVSSFAYHKSLKTVHQEFGPPPRPGVPSLDYYSDPRNVGRNVEESFLKYGMEIPKSVRDTIDDSRDGKLPEGLDL